jgi:uncharacterized protein (DUF2237 family)
MRPYDLNDLQFFGPGPTSSGSRSRTLRGSSLGSFEAEKAPRVVLRATHEAALASCSLADLKRFAVDLA